MKAAQVKQLTYQQELQLLKVGYCGVQGSTNVFDEKGKPGLEADEVKAAQIRRLTPLQELQPHELGHSNMKCNTGVALRHWPSLEAVVMAPHIVRLTPCINPKCRYNCTNPENSFLR